MALNRIFTIAFLLAAATACSGQDTEGQSSTSQQVDTLASIGMDARHLEALRSAARDGTFQHLHSILILRADELIFEEYFSGFDARTLQYTASVSKSAGSILLGIAMDQGLLPGIESGVLDVPLFEVLPEYDKDFEADPRKTKILFRHALSMTGGLAWDESSTPYSDSDNDWMRASRSADPIGFALSRPVVAEPGAVFNYHGVYSILPSYLIQRETGESAEAFAADHLFGPLGITEWRWDDIANGLTDTDGGLHLRPRDMAKLGRLYLNEGEWEGRQVVSAAWVEESTSPQIDNRDSPDYCLLWWCGDMHYGGRSAWTFLASGHGGQKIFVFPDLDLVVVVTQQVFENPYEELNNLAIMSRYVLPAADPEFQDAAPVQLDRDALARYEGYYSGPTSSIRVELRDGSLFADSEDAPTIRLQPLGEGRFRGTVMDMLDVEFEFQVGDSDRAQSIRVTFGFREDQFTRVEP